MKYKFTAQAARWFDKINGNTYHSVRITNNETGEVLKCQFQYGYGEHYRQTALEEMLRCGWIDAKYSDRNLFNYEREHNYNINWIVTDGLKRDCVANGR